MAHLIETGNIDIEAIRDQYPLADIVAPYVTMKRRGNMWEGLCPFHEERSPSFKIYDSDQRYHCFGCGAHGDLFDFLHHMEGLTIREAAERITGGICPTYTPDRLEEIRAKRAAFEAAEADRRSRATMRAREEWLGADPNYDEHPYLTRKGIRPHGTRLKDGKVLIPLIGNDGKIQTLQAIDADGKKRFTTDAPVTGGLFVMGGKVAKTETPVLICEGFATGASLHEATGWVVVCTFNSGNLVCVADRLAHTYPNKEYIIAGDDDHGKTKNVGREAALEAGAILKARVLFPALPSGCTGTDFNDMAAEYGVDAVKALIVDDELPDGTPAPDESLEAAKLVLGFDITDWSTSRFYGEAPPINWLCENTIPQGIPALFAAMGGVGKSFIALDLALEIAVSVATGIGGRKILGGKVIGHGNVVVLNAEDSKDSVHRRLERIDPSDRRQKANGRVFVVPLPEVGGPMPLISGGNGEFKKTEKFEALRTQLKAIPDLKLVVIDPLQAFITADVTKDPAAGQFMWSALSQLCAETGATIILCHHMRKEGASKINSAEDAREAIRGSTALIDGARATYALWGASEDENRRVCQEAGVEMQPKRVVHGAVVKSNDEHDWEIHTYLRADSGLLEDATDLGRRVASKQVGLTEAQALECLQKIDERWCSGSPFSLSAQAPDRLLNTFLIRKYGLDKQGAKRQIEDWFGVEFLTIETRDPKHHIKGLRVVKWPG